MRGNPCTFPRQFQLVMGCGLCAGGWSANSASERPRVGLCHAPVRVSQHNSAKDLGHDHECKVFYLKYVTAAIENNSWKNFRFQWLILFQRTTVSESGAES